MHAHQQNLELHHKLQQAERAALAQAEATQALAGAKEKAEEAARRADARAASAEVHWHQRQEHVLEGERAQRERAQRNSREKQLAQHRA